MKALPLTFALVSMVLGVAACGGKNKGGPATPAGASAEGDDAATPFNDAAVKAALANTPGVAECGADASSTMGAHFAAQRESLVGTDHTPVSESFACRAQDDGMWECEWSVFTVPGAPSPDDPCAGEGGSGYIIVAPVDNNGAIATDKITCNAPG